MIEIPIQEHHKSGDNTNEEPGEDDIMTRKHAIPNAESLMNRRIHTVTPEMTLSEIVQSLTKHKVSCAPVVNETESGQKALIGFVSEQDCLEYLSNEMFYGNPGTPQTGATIMKKHPICISPDIDVFALSSIFVQHGMRHLPVIDAKHCLLGLVSRRDILIALGRFYDENDDKWRLEHFPPDLHLIMNHRFIVDTR